MLCMITMYNRKPQFANLVTHPGFSEQLCYGDVSLRFMYAWSEMSKRSREQVLRDNHGLQSPVMLHEQKPASKMTAQ